MSSFYSEKELEQIGFKSLGQNVLISKKSSVYGANNISIGNNVRVDDFCILSGNISIGNYVHISAYTGLFGGEKGITIGNFVAISSRICIYAVNDDYSGESLVNPMVPLDYRNVTEKEVIVKDNVIIGSGSTVLPGVTIEEGVSVGAMSFINKDLEEWTMYAGIPCKKIKARSKKMLEYLKFIN